MDEIFKEEDIEKDESTTNVACETNCYCGFNGVPWVGTSCKSTDCSERTEPVTKAQQELSEKLTLREISKTIRKQLGESYKVEDHIPLIKDDSTCSCSDELCEIEESANDNESTVCKCRKVYPWIEITCDSPTCLNEKKQESLIEISYPKDQLFPAVVSACVCGSPYPWLSITCPPHSCTKSASAVMIKIDEQCICEKTPSWIEAICPSKVCTAQLNKKTIQNEIKKSACICYDSTINSICRTYACALKTQTRCVCEIPKPPKTGCSLTNISLIKSIMKLWSIFHSRRHTDLSCVCKTAGMSDSSNCRSKICPFNTTTRTSFRPRLYNIPLTDINFPIDISTSTCVCAQDGISIRVSCKSPDCNTRMEQIKDSKREVIEEDFFIRSQSSAVCICKDCSSQAACSSRQCQNKMDTVYHTGIPCSTCVCVHDSASCESKDSMTPVESSEYPTKMDTISDEVITTGIPCSTYVWEQDGASLEVSCKSPDCIKRTIEIDSTEAKFLRTDPPCTTSFSGHNNSSLEVSSPDSGKKQEEKNESKNKRIIRSTSVSRVSASCKSKDSMSPVESSEYPTKMDTSDEVITTGIPCSTYVYEEDGASLEVSCKSPDCIKRTIEIDTTETKFLRTDPPCTTSFSGHDNSSLEVPSPDSGKKQEEKNDSKNERIIGSTSASRDSASRKSKDSMSPVESSEYPTKMDTSDEVITTGIPCSTYVCEHDGASLEVSCKSPDCIKRTIEIDSTEAQFLRTDPPCTASVSGHDDSSLEVSSPDSEKKQEEKNDFKNERIIGSASVSRDSASCECKDSILPIEFWEYPIKMTTTESTVYNTVTACSKCACPVVESSSKITPNCETKPVRIDDPKVGSMKQSPSKIGSLAGCGSKNFTVDVQTPEYSIKIETAGAILQVTSKSSHGEKKMLEIKESQRGISKGSCSKSRSKDDGFSLEVLYKSLDCEERTTEYTNSKCRMIENQSSSGCIIKSSVMSGQCSEYPLKIDASRVADYPTGSSRSILLCSQNGTSLEEASASSPNKITVEIVGYSCETKDESALASRSAGCSSKNSVSSADSAAREISPKETVDAATDSRMSDKLQSPKEVTFVTPKDLRNNMDSSEDIIDSETGSLD